MDEIGRRVQLLPLCSRDTAKACRLQIAEHLYKVQTLIADLIQNGPAAAWAREDLFRVLHCICHVRTVRVALCENDLASSCLEMDTGSRLVVAGWNDMYATLFIFECQLRLLAMDASTAAEAGDCGAAASAVSFLPESAPLLAEELGFWRRSLGTPFEALPMSAIRDLTQGIMSQWNARPVTDDDTFTVCRILYASSLLVTLSDFPGSDMYDVPSWHHSGTQAAAMKPTPEFFRFVERAGMLHTARVVASAAMLEQSAPYTHVPLPPDTDAAAELVTAWWQGFDVGHITAGLHGTLTEECIADTALTPLDPYLVRGGKGGCPEENRLAPAMWILAERYIDDVDRLKKKADDFLSNEVSLFEIFNYTVMQTCGYKWLQHCYITDRQPLRMLKKQKMYTRTRMVRPMPMIIQCQNRFNVLSKRAEGGYAVYQCNCRPEALAVWCKLVLEHSDGVIARRCNIKDVIQGILKAVPASRPRATQLSSFVDSDASILEIGNNRS